MLMQSCEKISEMKMEQDVLDFVMGSQEIVSEHTPKLVVCSCCNRRSFIFGATSNFLKLPWRDWVIFDWGEEGHLPCHFPGFVDLSTLPSAFIFTCSLSSGMRNGIFAIVECATCNTDEELIQMSEIFVPITEIVGGFTGNLSVIAKVIWPSVRQLLSPLQLLQMWRIEQHAFADKIKKKWKEDLNFGWKQNQICKKSKRVLMLRLRLMIKRILGWKLSKTSDSDECDRNLNQISHFTNDFNACKQFVLFCP